MQNKKKAVMLTVILLAASLALLGCLYAEDAGGREGGPGFARRGLDSRSFNESRRFGPDPRGNLTEEQRQEFMKLRLKAAQDACTGKAENDECVLTGLARNGEPNNRTMKGTCQLGSDQTLACRPNIQRPLN